MQIDPAKLTEARLARAMSQEEVAIATDLSSRTIQRIEAGHRASLESTKALLSMFDADILWDPEGAGEAADKLLPRQSIWRKGHVFRKGAALGWVGLKILFLLALGATAAAKLVSPSSAGMWMDRSGDQLQLWYGVFDSPPAATGEMLGLWFVPLTLLFALLLAMSFAWFRNQLAKWRPS